MTSYKLAVWIGFAYLLWRLFHSPVLFFHVQDAHEFLGQILDQLKEEVLKISKTKHSGTPMVNGDCTRLNGTPISNGSKTASLTKVSEKCLSGEDSLSQCDHTQDSRHPLGESLDEKVKY